MPQKNNNNSNNNNNKKRVHNSSYYRSQVKGRSGRGYNFSDKAKRRRKNSNMRALVILFAFMFVASGFIFLGLFLRSFTNESLAAPAGTLTGAMSDVQNFAIDAASVSAATNITVPNPMYTQPEATTAEAAPPADIDAIYENFNGVYLDISKLSTLEELQVFIDGIKSKSINAVSIDIKREDGIIPISLDNGMGSSISAIMPTGDIKIKEALSLLHQNGIYVSGIISCFIDNIAGTTLPNDVLKNAATQIQWNDSEGNYWLSAYSSVSVGYVVSLAVESAKAGFDEIVLKNCYFPLVSDTKNIIYNDGGESKYDAIRQCITSTRYALDEVSPKIKLGIDIPIRYFLNTPSDITGVDPAALTGIVNFITTSFAPEQIKDSYKINGEKVNNPSKNPHDSVEALCRHFDSYIKTIMFRPKLQAYNSPDGTVYDEKKIQSQKQALYEANLGVWELVNYDNRY